MADPRLKSMDGLPTFQIYTQSAIGLKGSKISELRSKMIAIQNLQKRLKSDLRNTQKSSNTTFGDLMRDIIEPQVDQLIKKDPRLGKSDSLLIEKAKFKPGSTRVQNVVKLMKSLGLH